MTARTRIKALEAIASPSDKERCTIVIWPGKPALPKCPRNGIELTRDQDGKPAECSSCRIPESGRVHIFVKWV